MLNLDLVNATITAAGPLDEEILAIARLADDQWIIQYDGAQVELECEPESERLMFSAVIGIVPVEQPQMLANMMAYGLLWRETHGLRIALTPGERKAVLMVDLVGNELSPALIALVATNLAERSLLWLSIIEADGLANATVTDHQDPSTLQQFIKI